MKCPECGSEEHVIDSGEYFCKKCGIELEQLVFRSGKHGKLEVVALNNVSFKTDPKIELYALKFGLKNNKLSSDWKKHLGFTINGTITPEMKEKVLFYIKKAYENNKDITTESLNYFRENWATINNKFFIETEEYMKIKWPSQYFDCYLSFTIRFGIHNSSRNMIIVNQGMRKVTNYLVAHELFQIMYRSYVNRFFKEKYTDIDKILSKIISAYVLLGNEKLKTSFKELKLDINIFAPEYRETAEKISNIFTPEIPFKELMIRSYKEIGHEKKWVSY